MSEISSNVSFLFQQIKIIEMEHKRINISSSEQFNIFSILHKPHDEVKLHSKFIYELMNPNGSHMQNNIFLKLFLDEIDLINEDELVVYREKHNIDILVQSKDNAIIIENKIYTEDHSKQLSTYVNLLKDKGYKSENISLVYLTLFGDEPNETKVKDIVKNISYEINIVRWLEKCIKEVSTIPTIRETIIQYLNLIKHLTNQSQIKGYIVDIKELLLKDNNLKLALDMQKSIVQAKIDIHYTFWNSLQNMLNSKELNFKFTSDNKDNNFKVATENYYLKLKNKRNFGLEYQIDTNLVVFIEVNYRVFYGFYTKNKKLKQSQRDLIEQINEDWEKTGEDIFWKYPDLELNFETFNDHVVSLSKETNLNKTMISICENIEKLVEGYKCLTSTSSEH